MTIDKQKLWELLWAEVAAWSVSAPDWPTVTQDLEEFLGKQTLEEVALELLVENGRLEQIECAFSEWIEKTDWVQKNVHFSELGMHRADVLRKRIDALDVENGRLRSDIETWRLSIQAERNCHRAEKEGLQQELDQLKGPSFAEELQALRTDAEQWRALVERAKSPLGMAVIS